MRTLRRCPECHLVIIPQKVYKQWKRKFGTNEKPHHLKKCKLCGVSAGEHIGTECPMHKKEGE